ncbi:MAG: ATP-binding protein [Chloroflexota bacterium]
MIRRGVVGDLMAALGDTPVVFIQGPRQAGKSTLAQAALGERPGQYLTLDDVAVLRAATSDPDGFVAGLSGRVVLDEVQLAPGLFRAIKASVDRDRRPGRFLLTGSANALLVPEVAQALAGRLELITLWPFSQGEIEERLERFVDASFERVFEPSVSREAVTWADLVDRIARGGFPEAQGRRSGERRRAWFRSYESTVLDRDVREIANIEGRRELPRLLRLTAARTAGLLNAADLARDAAMAQSTLRRYWTLFEMTFLVNTLPAWSTNRGHRIAKAPKVHVVDSGLLCHLLGLDERALRGDALWSGQVLESFVAGELSRQIGWSQSRPTLHHFRTHTRQEVDLVLEHPDGRVVGVEVKRSASPSAADFRGLRHLREIAGARFYRGVVLYLGANVVPFGENLYAVPISALWLTA